MLRKKEYSCFKVYGGAEHVTLQALASAPSPPPSGVWLIETPHPTEASRGLPVKPFWIPQPQVDPHGVKWRLLNGFASLQRWEDGKMRAPGCWLPAPLILPPSLLLSLPRDRSLCAAWEPQAFQSQSTPFCRWFVSFSLATHARTGARERFGSQRGLALEWIHSHTHPFPFLRFLGTDETGSHLKRWPAQLEMIFRQPKCISVPTFCTHILPGWAWYNQKLPEITNLPKNLAESMMIN